MSHPTDKPPNTEQTTSGTGEVQIRGPHGGLATPFDINNQGYPDPPPQSSIAGRHFTTKNTKGGAGTPYRTFIARALKDQVGFLSVLPKPSLSPDHDDGQSAVTSMAKKRRHNDGPGATDDTEGSEGTENPPGDPDALMHNGELDETPNTTPAITSPSPDVKFTPAPEGGFPIVHGWDEESIFENLHPSCRAKWEAHPGPKALVWTYEGGYDSRNPNKSVDLVRDAIASIFRCQPRVAPPFAEFSVENMKSPPPYMHLVTNIPEGVATALVNQRCWATPSVTLFAIPFNPSISDYLLSIGRLSTEPSNDTDVVNYVVNAMLGSAEIVKFIRERHTVNLLTMDPDDAVIYVLESIYVRHITVVDEKDLLRLWNVYIPPPTSTLAEYRAWKTLFNDLVYDTDFKDGVGKRYTGNVSCSGCKSMDHTDRNCPFPTLPGWLGPRQHIQRHDTKPKDTKPQTTFQPRGGAPRGGQDGRGGRGGRGRGDRGRGDGRGTPSKGGRKGFF